MLLSELEVGKEYLMLHAYGQPPQKVKVLHKDNTEALVKYTSDDCTKGMTETVNQIVCERYLRPIPT